MLYFIIIACIIPACITMFAYHSKRKRESELLSFNNRESLTLSLQHDDQFYSVKRSKSALKKRNSCSTTGSRKSVQFNEVVLEVFDLINEDEQEEEEEDNKHEHRLSCPKIVKSSLKNEKINVPIRYSNTKFPKTIINDFNGEIINFNHKKEDTNPSTTSSSPEEEKKFPEIRIINDDEDKSTLALSQEKDTDNEKNNTFSLSYQINDVAKTVITSEANPATNLINEKSNTLPRRSRPSHKGHRRQSSVRLTCIY